MSGQSRKFAPLSLGLAVALALVFGSSLVMAQMPPPSDRTSGAPSGPTVNSVEGKVSKVDPASGKVKISAGLFGLFGRTLEVTPDTQIQLQGKPGSLAELREGDKVKASYEARAGQKVARSIDVLPGEEPRRSSRPKTDSGAPAAAPAGTTTQPEPPASTTQPKTE